jgi:hypothetical protein
MQSSDFNISIQGSDLVFPTDVSTWAHYRHYLDPYFKIENSPQSPRDTLQMFTHLRELETHLRRIFLP